MSWEDEVVGPDVDSAGLHISERIGRDVAAQFDLEEALEASRYASHPYSSHPKEWPPLYEVVESRELPPVLIERYNVAGGEGTALCGIFPEIRRAWASVDSSLFLWRFDKWDGHCPEYSAEEQAICAVGLVKSKPGVFVEAIQYLLVLATPVELVLVGVCCTVRADGVDPYAEISLQPLPEYTVSTDGVTMTSITCSDKGHIFLAGRDGHIYEMQYSSGSGWHKRCHKICLTAGLTTLISRWVLPNALKFGSVDPICDMVVDNERHILYARTEDMKLQVFDLGEHGDGPFRKIAEEKNLIDPRDAHYGARRSDGSRTASRGSKASIACISPLSMIESRCIHVIAVLSDGRRLYLSTSSSFGGGISIGGFTGIGSTKQRPRCLKVVASRPSPPPGAGNGITYGAVSLASRAQTDDLNLKVDRAFYSSGITLISDPSLSAMSSLLIVHRDFSLQSSSSGNLGMTRTTRALREIVSSFHVEGRMLFATDVLPHPEAAATIQSLYMDVEPCAFEGLKEPSEKASARLWARGDLRTQHILPRRRIVVFSTMGVTEIALNRPVDILRKLLESHSPRSLLEDFFNRFGPGEAAAMCLLLAAKLISSEENLISNSVAEKAAEAFEDPRIVGMPQLDHSSSLSNARMPPGGFSMGQVVQEAEPVFSGAHEGLCLCSSRLLYPIWEFPIVVVQGKVGLSGVIICRLSADAMQVLERKICSLEMFLRSRRNQRRGLYGFVAGLGDRASSILHRNVSDSAVGQIKARSLLNSSSQYASSSETMHSSKRQRLPYSPAELAAMEVRAMECLRRLLRRSSEALFLLQVFSQHHITRLVQSLDADLRQKLVQLTFHQLVCSEEGDRIATRLIAGLMEYYIGPDGRGTVDEMSGKLRDGCPSYFNESDYKYFAAVECLEKASASVKTEDKKNLAKDALNLLTKIPESADLRSICKRFEDLRFYEAVVRLPLQKAQALDPNFDALNEKIDASRREVAFSLRSQCYEIVTSTLQSLKGEFEKLSNIRSTLDQSDRDKYIQQIVQLSIQWPDRIFHEYLYDRMINLGLENELLEFGGPDLVPFLQSAGREHSKEASDSGKYAKYLDLLAKYYVLKRQHLLAAHVLYRLAERRCVDPTSGPTLEQRQQYFSNAILQAKSSSSAVSALPAQNASDEALLEMLEGKLTVLRFQMKIKEELDVIASKNEERSSMLESSSMDPFPRGTLVAEGNSAKAARNKSQELAAELKSITQLYNEYAVPFQLWEICLEMLNFARYSGDADSQIVRETWARLLDQALSRGGIAEACDTVKRVGSILYPGDGASIPLDTLCLHLEKAALERSMSGVELVGDEDVARSLLAACKGSADLVLNIYDQILSNGAVVASPSLRLRLLRSVLTVLREWATSGAVQKAGPSISPGITLALGRSSLSTSDQTTIGQGIRDNLISAANRYMTEVRRLALPQNQTEAVSRGFRELEEKVSSPYQF